MASSTAYRANVARARQLFRMRLCITGAVPLPSRPVRRRGCREEVSFQQRIEGRSQDAPALIAVVAAPPAAHLGRQRTCRKGGCPVALAHQQAARIASLSREPSTTVTASCALRYSLDISTGYLQPSAAIQTDIRRRGTACAYREIRDRHRRFNAGATSCRCRSLANQARLLPAARSD